MGISYFTSFLTGSMAHLGKTPGPNGNVPSSAPETARLPWSIERAVKFFGQRLLGGKETPGSRLFEWVSGLKRELQFGESKGY